MPVLDTIDRVRVTTYRGDPAEIAAIFACAPADPFRIESDCLNPAGHSMIVSCGDIVCRHCSKVFWL